MLQRLLIVLPFLLAGCINVPEGVEDFDLDRYPGTLFRPEIVDSF